MLKHGLTRPTDDLDIAVTANALAQFFERAEEHDRFSMDAAGDWYDKCVGEGHRGC